MIHTDTDTAKISIPIPILVALSVDTDTRYFHMLYVIWLVPIPIPVIYADTRLSFILLPISKLVLGWALYRYWYYYTNTDIDGWYWWNTMGTPCWLLASFWIQSLNLRLSCNPLNVPLVYLVDLVPLLKQLKLNSTLLIPSLVRLLPNMIIFSVDFAKDMKSLEIIKVQWKKTKKIKNIPNVQE